MTGVEHCRGDGRQADEEDEASEHQNDEGVRNIKATENIRATGPASERRPGVKRHHRMTERRTRVDLSLPDFIPVTPPLQVKASVTRTDFTRLPGLCQRLKRRRVTILCRLEKFCWRVRGQGRSQGRGQKNQSGQVCRCPRGSRCSHFFVHSL
ncbi:uncharacterized protein AKAME5_002353200 [Lates japonicus]|uniref:Uncharacterized protein n=1 Tax=Lates japonicus TaxID=270547 RepID=A0AAD3NFR3_LATJO|nr:uncharacterized protein AKAME5_002353200 [Lates japonicus]